MPDPKELLAKARQMVARMRADGVPDADIDGYLQSEIQLSLEQVTSPDVDDYLRAAGMGASFGFLDELAGAGAAIVPGGKGYTEARDEVRTNYDAANEAATGADQAKLTGAELGGGALTSLAGGALLGLAGRGASAMRATGTAAKALRGAQAGAAGGVAAGTGYSQAETPGELLRDAGASGILGAAGGAAVPIVGAGLGKVGGIIRDMARPGKAVAREVGTQMPANAAQTLARQEALAPGTALPGDLTPEMTALTRGIGAEPAAAQAAKATAVQRVEDLRKALRTVGKEYDQFNGQRLPLTPEAASVLRKHGHLVQNDVDFEVAHKLRTKLRERLQETKKGSVKQETAPDKSVLDQFLNQHIPQLADIDSKYGFLNDAVKRAKALAKEVTNSSKAHAVARAYGQDAGSIGGSLPAGPRGLVDRLVGLLEPNKADRARAAHGLLTTPGAPLVPAASFGAGGQLGSLLTPGRDLGMGWLSGRSAAGLLGE